MTVCLSRKGPVFFSFFKFILQNICLLINSMLQMLFMEVVPILYDFLWTQKQMCFTTDANCLLKLLKSIFVN